MDLFVPGRLCILGEHTDWIAEYRKENENVPKGYTLVCATNEGLYARLSVYNAGWVKIISTAYDESTHVLDEALDEDAFRAKAKEGGYLSYIYGTMAAVLALPSVRALPQPLRGLCLHNQRTTLPMKKGLSSSAAVCVLVAQAFSSSLGLGLRREEVMELAYRGEMLTPSRCGRMDQCVAMGGQSIALMAFDQDQVSLQLLCPMKALHFVVVDLQGEKDTVAILRSLNNCLPFPSSPTQELLLEYARDIARIAERARECIEEGRLEELGGLMGQAQGAFDRGAMANAPAELSSPLLHSLLVDVELRGLCLGGKGVGSQGDGAAQFLVQDEQAQGEVLRYVKEKYGMEGFPLTVPASGTS